MSDNNQPESPEQDIQSKPAMRTNQLGWMLAAFVAGFLGKAYGVTGGLVMLAVFFFLQKKTGPINAIVAAAVVGIAAGLGVQALLGSQGGPS